MNQGHMHACSILGTSLFGKESDLANPALPASANALLLMMSIPVNGRSFPLHVYLSLIGSDITLQSENKESAMYPVLHFQTKHL